MNNSNHTGIAGDFSPGRFLLVDDEIKILEVLGRFLSSAGLDFLSATDGQKAIEILKSEHFDVVISDISMPRFNGIELLRFIRKEHAGIDVILMTGYSQSYTFTDVIREGAIDYLEKPFTTDAVRAKISRILKERSLRTEYNQELDRRREVERILQKKSSDLEKRVRELNCLYQISSIVEQKKRAAG